MIHHVNCPACQSKKIAKIFSARDHTVSQEVFEIWECRDCTLRFTQNIPDESAITKYYQSEEYISHSDTKKGLVNTLYHKVRNITLRNKFSIVKKYTGLEKGNVLDIGAGTGAFLNQMKEKGWNVKGLEPEEKAREFAQVNYEILLDPPQNLEELLEGTFDAITLWHVLEHVHNLKLYLNRFYELLKEKGVLFVAVPNYLSADAKKYGPDWAAYDVPRHLYHFSPRSMKILMRKYGFSVDEVLPMKFDSFYVSMLSEKIKANKLPLVSGGFSGLLSNLRAGDENYSSLIYVIRKK